MPSLRPLLFHLKKLLLALPFVTVIIWTVLQVQHPGESESTEPQVDPQPANEYSAMVKTDPKEWEHDITDQRLLETEEQALQIFSHIYKASSDHVQALKHAALQIAKLQEVKRVEFRIHEVLLVIYRNGLNMPIYPGEFVEARDHEVQHMVDKIYYNECKNHPKDIELARTLAMSEIKTIPEVENTLGIDPMGIKVTFKKGSGLSMEILVSPPITVQRVHGTYQDTAKAR
jgi:hypothetical protein